ncbi:hypothetical protein PDL71_02420 [Lacibacter sp. MH-610]|uniref:hypothetical protein n=1 Tax=Lacibacter sp. MH-610 TaxID=3020883 RepID=UPI0038916C42
MKLMAAIIFGIAISNKIFSIIKALKAKDSGSAKLEALILALIIIVGLIVYLAIERVWL